MSLNQMIKARHTLSFHLRIRYAAVFVVLSLIAFTIFHFLISSILLERTDAALKEELSEFSSLFINSGIEAVKAGIAIEAGSEDVEECFFRLFTSEGKTLAATEFPGGKDIPLTPVILKRLSDDPEPYFETHHVPGRKSGIRTVYSRISDGLGMEIGQSLKDDNQLSRTLIRLLGVTLLVLLLFTTLIGWMLARKALGSVEAVTQTALQISGGDFHKRVPVDSRYEEIDRLAGTFNGMLDHIQNLMVELREVTDNIAHDLKSPITGIRGLAEMILFQKNSSPEVKKLSADTIHECERLMEMINTMLTISETESGGSIDEREPIDIAVVARQALDLFQPLAEEKNIHISEKIPDHCWIEGQLPGIQRMISNLLDNALKYTPEGGVVKLSIHVSGKEAYLLFRDTGVGISEKDLPHIFNRFYRADRSRSKSGSGLGLCLARAVIKAHGGDISVKSHFGKGSEFIVSLPHLSPPPPLFNG